MATQAKERPDELKKADDTKKVEESANPAVEDPNEAVALALKFRMMSGNPLELNCSGCKEWDDVRQRAATHLGTPPFYVRLLANGEQYRPMCALKDIDPSIEITVIQEPMPEFAPRPSRATPPAMSPAEHAMMLRMDSQRSLHSLQQLELQRKQKKAKECVDWERLEERWNNFTKWMTPGWYTRYQDRQTEKRLRLHEQEMERRRQAAQTSNSSNSLNRLYGLAGDAQHAQQAAMALGYITGGQQGIPAEPVPKSQAAGSRQGNRT